MLDEIRLLPPELLATQDTAAIAAALSVGRTKPSMQEVGNGLVLETLGITAGNAFLDVIYNVPDFRHVKPLVEQGRLNISSALVQATIQSLVPAVLTQPECDALCNLGKVPDPVDELTVRRACWSDDGVWQV